MEVPTMDEPAHFALFGNPISQSVRSSTWTPMSMSGPPAEWLFVRNAPHAGAPRRRSQRSQRGIDKEPFRTNA